MKFMELYSQLAHPIDYRYGSEEMRKIFSVENLYQTYAYVESVVAEVQAEMGLIPKEAAKKIKEVIKKIRYEEIIEEEKKVKHDLFALLNVISKHAGEYGEYVHLGLTSSDVKDTALVLILREGLRIIKEELINLTKILVSLAIKYKDLPCVARTHGVHANIYLFGHKFAIWADEFRRHLERILELERRLYVGKLSGSVGIHIFLGELGEKIEEEALSRMNLKVALGVNQIIQRDIFAELIFTLALISSTLDKIATEIRNLQRTEILEVEEPFGREQIGSSAMPHKRNPILSENICSLAKIMRSLVIPALENIVSWHERDLTNSASERIIFPEAFLILDEQIRKMIKILSNLKVNKERIHQNINLTNGLILSEILVSLLVRKGLSRRKAYMLVRDLAIKCWNEKLNLLEALKKSEKIMKHLNEEDFSKLTDIDLYLKVGKLRIEKITKEVTKFIESLESQSTV